MYYSPMIQIVTQCHCSSVLVCCTKHPSQECGSRRLQWHCTCASGCHGGTTQTSPCRWQVLQTRKIPVRHWCIRQRRLQQKQSLLHLQTGIQGLEGSSWKHRAHSRSWFLYPVQKIMTMLNVEFDISYSESYCIPRNMLLQYIFN